MSFTALFPKISQESKFGDDQRKESETLDGTGIYHDAVREQEIKLLPNHIEPEENNMWKGNT